jgi:radical SAM superfamily enzyme YgiQ (UPF0313 family)
MKLLLINPPISGYNERDLYGSEPLGLAYLAGYLETKNETVEVLDCFALGMHQVYQWKGYLRKGLTNEQIKTRILEIKPDIVGIHSNFTMYYPDAREVAEVVRETLPHCRILLGGAHATMEANSIVDSRVADIVVRGEGEMTIFELLQAFKNKTPLNEVLGLTYRADDGTLVKTADRPLWKQIEELPFPAWHKLNMDIYAKYSKASSPFSKNHPTASLITSRGCPFDCVFCSTKNMWRKKWRADSAEKVVEEIEFLAKNYGIKEIIIQDDNFIADKRRVHKICDLLIEKKLGVSLHDPAGFTVWTVDEELLIKMKKAGFYRVLFPVETGSEKTMKYINKPVILSEVPQKVRFANQLGFWTQSNFIIGFPYETKEDVLETIQYAFNSGFDFAAFLIAQPFAGAEMYNTFRDEGLMEGARMDKRSIFYKTQFNTKYLKAEEIQKLRDYAASRYLLNRLKFLANPAYFFRYFWPKINSWPKFIYFLRISFGNFSFIFNRYRKNDIALEADEQTQNSQPAAPAVNYLAAKSNP